MDPTERLVSLFHLTLDVHRENRTLLHCAIDKFKGLNYALDRVAGAKDILGPHKAQRFIQQWNQNGNTILHESAKKGNCSKGQLISKCLLGIFNSLKKTNKKISTLLQWYLKSNCFYSFFWDN